MGQVAQPAPMAQAPQRAEPLTLTRPANQPIPLSEVVI